MRATLPQLSELTILRRPVFSGLSFPMRCQGQRTPGSGARRASGEDRAPSRGAASRRGSGRTVGAAIGCLRRRRPRQALADTFLGAPQPNAVQGGRRLRWGDGGKRSLRARAARRRKRRMDGVAHDLSEDQWTALKTAWGGCAYCGATDRPCSATAYWLSPAAGATRSTTSRPPAAPATPASAMTKSPAGCGVSGSTSGPS